MLSLDIVVILRFNIAKNSLEHKAMETLNQQWKELR